MDLDAQKLLPTTLRKGRIEGIRGIHEDTESNRLYTQLLRSFLGEQLLPLACFCNWRVNQCRGEEESEEEYVQSIYYLLTHGFFLSQDRSQQVYALYALYCLLHSTEVPRFIPVDVCFIRQLGSFISLYASKRLSVLKVINRLQECFMYTFDVASRMLPIRNESRESMVHSQRLPASETNLKKIKEQLPSIHESLLSYCSLKQKLFKLTDSEMKANLSQVDKHTPLRIKALLNYVK